MQNIDLNILGANIEKNVNAYFNLDFLGTLVKAPYFINHFGIQLKSVLKENLSEPEFKKLVSLVKNNELVYGHFGGKGTPQELIDSTNYLSNKYGFDLSKLSSERIYEIMRFFGIGIDCSGFAYNVLDASLGSNFLYSNLKFPSDPTRFHVNVSAFANNENSRLLDKGELFRTGDLIIRNFEKHMVLVTSVADTSINCAHSSFPYGVEKFSLDLKEAQNEIIRRLHFLDF